MTHVNQSEREALIVDRFPRLQKPLSHLPFECDLFACYSERRNGAPQLFVGRVPADVQEHSIDLQRALEHKDMASFEFVGGPAKCQRAVGVVRIGQFRFALVKTAMPPIDLDVSYVIDSFYLTALKRKMLLLMEPETVDLLGWIDKVHDDLVNISYQDEAGHLVYADVPRDWFHRFHDLGEGSQFVIQTWEEAGEPRCEFLPVADSDPARSRSAAARAIQRFEHSHKKLPMPDPDHPAKPKDWSNPDEVLRYYKALDERYKNIDWGRGTRP